MRYQFYRDRYQIYWCQQSTTETGISSVGVSRVLQRHVSVLLVLAEYYRDMCQFCWCKLCTTETGFSSVGVS